MVTSFNHIFNVEYAEARRRTPKLPQRWQWNPISTALTRELLRKVVERLPVKILGVCISPPHDPSSSHCVAGYR